MGRLRWIVNISVVFLLSGIWHGATWSFVVWGGIHALFYLIEYYVGSKKPGLPYHVLVFLSVTLAWIFFRIESFSTAFAVIYRICSGWREPLQWGSSQFSTLLTLALGMLFVIREYLLYKQLLPQKYMIEYVLLILGICLFGVSSDQFVYFQF